MTSTPALCGTCLFRRLPHFSGRCHSKKCRAMWGGSTRIMEAEGTCMTSASRSTISCHFRMITEGTSIECATLEPRSCGSEAVLSPWIPSLMKICDNPAFRSSLNFSSASAKARRQIHGLYAARIDRDETKIIAAFGHVDRPVGNPKLSAVCRAWSFGACRKGQPCTLARLAGRYLWRELLLAVRAPSTCRP